ncbi:MAG: T9SS type A sorting domain-containing protein [Aureispira sp.]
MQGQAPVWLHNTATVEPSHLTIRDSIVTIGGSFQQGLEGQTALGRSDLFFYQYNQEQELLGKYYLQGKDQDRLMALAALSNGGWYAVGSFRDSLFFGAKNPILYQNKRSVFIGKWQTNGQVTWAKSLLTTGFLEVFDAVSDSSGALYLTGSFQDTLFLDPLPPLVTTGIKAPFVLKIEANGQFLWGITSTFCQEAAGKSLALDEQGKLYWAGEFSGKLTMKDKFRRAHPVYRDLFLLTLHSQTGRQLAQKQFSGVYDNQCDVLAYHDHKLYLAGRFSGYLQLDSILLRTAFKTFGNAYVALLDTTGQTEWAVQSTTFADAYCTDLAIDRNHILLAGYYLDSIQWGAKKAGSMDGSEAFLVSIGAQGQSFDLITSQGKGFDVARGVEIDAQNNTWLIGGFQDSMLLWEKEQGVAQGASDGFIWRKPPSHTWSKDKLPSSTIPIPTIIFPSIQLSPQPAVNRCTITVTDGGIFKRWTLYNTQGQLVDKGNTPVIPTQKLRKKVYSLHIETSEGLAIEKLLVK